jgi:hypothetical protein
MRRLAANCGRSVPYNQSGKRPFASLRVAGFTG